MTIRLVFETSSREDPAPSENERCTGTICVTYTAPRCLPQRQSATVILIIRPWKVATSPRVTLIVTDISSGKEVERHVTQKVPPDGAYRWIFDAVGTPKTGTIHAYSEALAYTLDPNKTACLTVIG